MLGTHLGYFNTASSRTHVRFHFSTHAAAGGNVAPLSAFEAADIRIYKAADGAAFSATQRSSSNGITMTSPFDSLTGFHDVDIDLTDNTDAGFYAAGGFYSVVLSPDTETIDSQTITGIVLAYFEIGPPPANVTQFGGTAGTFNSGRPEVNTTHAAGTAWNSGAITSSTLAADCIGASQIATDAIGSSELAASAVTEIWAAVADSAGVTTLLTRLSAARAGYLDNINNSNLASVPAFPSNFASLSITAGGIAKADVQTILATAVTQGGAGRLAGAFSTLFDVASPALTAASVNQTGDSYARLGAPAGASVSADIAAVPAAVWDLSTTGHTTSGTFGAAMNAAGSAGDPWATNLPGAYSAGTAGYVVGALGNAFPVIYGTVGSGPPSPTTLQIPTDLTTTAADTLKDKRIVFLSGALATDFESRLISSSGSGANSALALDEALSTAPTAGDAFVVVATHNHSIASIVAAILAGSLSSETGAGTLSKAISDTLSQTAASAIRADLGLASANLDTQLDALPTAAENATAVWANGTRTLTALGFTYGAGDFGTDWLTSTGLAASAVTEIWAAVADSAGVTTLLSRLSAARAGYLDNINNANLASVPAFPSNFSSLGINASGHISRVTLVDTTTANTDMITAAAVRSAIGMASANLDTQIGTLATSSSISALNNISSSDVLTQVNSGLDATFGLPGQATPSNTPTTRTALAQLYQQAIRPYQQDSSEQRLYNSAASTVLQKRTVSELAGVLSFGPLVTGP